jgi:hypothetical protein
MGLRLVLIIGLFLRCGSGAVCQNGLSKYYGDTYITIVTTANIDCNGTSGNSQLKLLGAYRASLSGVHKFRLWSEKYSSSCVWPVCTSSSGQDSTVYFELENVGYGPTETEWDTKEFTLYKDFQYQLKAITSVHYFVRLRVSVQFTSHPMYYLAGDLIAICERNGCREEFYNRQPYSCQPSPSRSPSPTKSHSPTTTIRRSQSSAFKPSLVLFRTHPVRNNTICEKFGGECLPRIPRLLHFANNENRENVQV